MKKNSFRFLTLLLCLIMIFTLCACGDKDSSIKEENNNNENTIEVESKKENKVEEIVENLKGENDIRLLYDTNIKEQRKDLKDFDIEPCNVYSDDFIKIDFKEVEADSYSDDIEFIFNVAVKEGFEIDFGHVYFYINDAGIKTSVDFKSPELIIEVSATELLVMGITEIESVRMDSLTYFTYINEEPVTEHLKGFVELHTSLLTGEKYVFEPEYVLYDDNGVKVSLLKASIDRYENGNGAFYLPVMIENNTDELFHAGIAENAESEGILYINGNKKSSVFLWGLEVNPWVQPGTKQIRNIMFYNREFEELGVTLNDNFDIDIGVVIENDKWITSPTEFKQYMSGLSTVHIIH